MFQSPKEALQPEAAPPPPQAPLRRSRPILSAASGLLSFLLVAAIMAALGFSVAATRMRAPGPLQAEKVVEIPAHTDVPDVIAELQREGVIDNGLLFNIALVAEGKRAKIRAGEYLFPQYATMQEVMDTIVSGRQVLHKVTIPEGLTSEQVVQNLRADDVLAGDILQVPKEGSLYPETYKFARGMQRADLIRKMQKDEDEILKQVWAHRTPNSPLRSPFELLTLASIVEKETGRADERPRVARVFLNRLAKRMRLQSDPTVVYGLVSGRGTLGHSITHAELTQPTPYNTYLIDGLPPGPICNPGRASLEAVANPSETNDLYFVADGTGGHVFAATLADHNKNVQHWRQVEKEKAAAAPDVDHVPAQDLPLPNAKDARPQQRGDLEPGDLKPGDLRPTDSGRTSSVFGALPSSFVGAAPAFSAPGGAFANLALAAPSLAYGTGQPDPGSGQQGQKQPIDPRSFGIGSATESLGLMLAEPPPKGTALLDGPADDPATDGTDAPDPAIIPARMDGPPTPSYPPINGHVRAVDASAGTPLDPLKNTTWDLNSPKTVPTFN